MRTILEAQNLVKTYRVGRVDVPALRGVSLEVEEGEFVAIMGPSGCGKSTMLHLLGGLLTPTTGRIIVDGEDMTAASDARRTDIRRRKIGFVFQRFNLFPTLTAEGNLRLAERIHGNGAAGDPTRRREVLRLLRLEDKLHRAASNSVWLWRVQLLLGPQSFLPTNPQVTSTPRTQRSF